MTKQNELIYDLIFSDVEYFEIDISDYISNIYDYEIFIKDIKCILNKSKVKIVSNHTLMSSKTIKWTLKVKR